MTFQEKDEKNKRLAKLLGLEWHELTDNGYCHTCGHHSCFVVNPDFTTDAGKVQLLREMMKQEGYDVFIIENGSISKHGRHLDCILVDLITDTTGKFRDACLEWLGGDE